MARTIVVEAREVVACPKCNHRFPLSEGISRQAIERHAAELERALAEGRKKLEAQLAAEAKAQFDVQLKALNEALSAKEGTLAKFRAEELALRRQLRQFQESIRNQELEYARKLDPERKKSHRVRMRKPPLLPPSTSSLSCHQRPGLRVISCLLPQSDGRLLTRAARMAFLVPR
jgi:hypothetical protein